MNHGAERLLLIDTCGETAGVALSAGDGIVAAQDLDTGRASAGIVTGIRELLRQTGWSLAELAAVAVVNGPGSFTGTRTGLAAAKGLCEAGGLPLVAVSRLAVLARAAKAPLAVLDAGRGEFYLRDEAGGDGGDAVERLCRLDDLAEILRDRAIAVSEERVRERRIGLGVRGIVFHPLHVGDALALALEALRSGPQDAAVLVEANYLRQEGDIYARTQPVAYADTQQDTQPDTHQDTHQDTYQDTQQETYADTSSGTAGK
jgi:tRNA threonylcarbamoyladenosine biosynthesis protein TsaB